MKMMFEIESSILEIEYEMKVKADIAKAYADLKSAHAANKFDVTVYEANKCEMDDVCDQLRRGWMKVSNEYDVESIYSVISSMYRTIGYVEYDEYVECDANPLDKCIPDSWLPTKKATMMSTNEYIEKYINKPIYINTPEPSNDADDADNDSDDDGFRVIMPKRSTKPYQRKPKVKPAIAELTRIYEITHNADIPKEIFYHNMSMAIQRFCANYNCTFDGYTIKYAYCNINFTNMLRDVGSKKLKYGSQVGVLIMEYKYTSTDLKNNAKEVNDAIQVALNELHNGLNMYAQCNYLCPY